MNTTQFYTHYSDIKSNIKHFSHTNAVTVNPSFFIAEYASLTGSSKTNRNARTMFHQGNIALYIEERR